VEILSRKGNFTLGVTLAILPIVLWIVLPAAYFVRIAAASRIDDRLVEDYAFMLGAVSQVVAIYFLKRSRQHPWDWLSAFSLIGAILSGLAIFVFVSAAVGNTLQGW
jgi:hypothetical protein